MRMNTWTMNLVIVSLVGIAGATLATEEHGHHGEATKEVKTTPQTTCPVMGGKVNKDLYVDHNGKRVYVCCEGCVGAVKKDPETYIKKLEDAGVTLDPAPQGEAKKKDANDGHKGHAH